MSGVSIEEWPTSDAQGGIPPLDPANAAMLTQAVEAFWITDEDLRCGTLGLESGGGQGLVMTAQLRDALPGKS